MDGTKCQKIGPGMYYFPARQLTALEKKQKDQERTEFKKRLAAALAEIERQEGTA